ncbi:MAG: GspH/FimT family pseudopilin [Methylobacter sp.]|nr:GspH/FimT family pseudopilin [Methylobacter sp.]MDP2429742.1 GspH/FimT family pseudopilin [Methylobacter sp.]MDP3054336.1 GspH/FimT family pseudopilin [Methylobacter sp.]MDP3361016.1 GspH/FimT family pseudopilin [Methylobacter sp.]MDZ4220941.1 GspH/FimT family pseudopilin [Methylobacter sp.]
MNSIKNTGFTLIETMIVVAIIAILAAMAAPSFNSMLEKQRIVGVAETVLADLRWARAESIKRNRPVRVTFTTGSNWNYTIDTNPALAASDGVLPKTVNGSDFASTSLTTDFTGGMTTFEAVRGTANKGIATITTTNFNAGVEVSTLGRVRICGSMGGYEACP